MVTQLPDKDEVHMTFQQMLARLDVCMGGRVAEEVQCQRCHPRPCRVEALAGCIRLQIHHVGRLL